MNDNGSISHSITSSYGFNFTPYYPGVIPSDCGKRNKLGSGMSKLIRKNNQKPMQVTRRASTDYLMVL